MKGPLRPNGLLAMLLETGRRLYANRVFEMSAALAFYSALSLAPVIVISLGIAGSLVDRTTVRTHLIDEAERVAGHEAAELVRKLADERRPGEGGATGTIIGIVTLAFGATAAFGQLQEGLDRIWDVTPAPQGGVWLFFRRRMLALVMVLALGLLLLVSVLVSTTLSLIAHHTPMPASVSQTGALVHVVASLVVFTLLFALVFRLLPNTRVGHPETWGGGLLTAVLFQLGAWGIGEYLGRASIGSAYGTAGTLVVLLVWVYYSAVIVFGGAQFTFVWSMRRGRRPRAPKAVAPSPGRRAK
jgi:membrane protein